MNDDLNMDSSCSEDEDCGQEEVPGLFGKGWNLLKDTGKLIRNTISGNKPLVPEEIAQERLDICSMCEYLYYSKNNRPKCSKCGCFMDIKTHISTSSCPVYKWQEWRDIDETKNN